ncbi:MAG: glycogen/starch/alpha-glucan family phosphorylase [Candidatus Margulisiibacteriota bacterium]|jgi:starch phosphorylase
MESIFGTKDQVKQDLTNILLEISGKELNDVNANDIYRAVQQLIIRKLMPLWKKNSRAYAKEKEIYYFSIEILLGRMLGTNLLALNANNVLQEVIHELGQDLDLLQHLENEPGLGNGGLGRLFACFLESMAALGIPGHGVCLLYKTGLMKQSIDKASGKQIAEPDHWNASYCQGLVPRQDESVKIDIGGRLVNEAREDGTIVEKVVDAHALHIMPWYIPIIGQSNHINNLILLSTDVSQNLDNDVFDTYLQGNINTNPFWKVMVSLKLYPSAKNETGKWLRFVQETVLALGGLRVILNKKIRSFFPGVDLTKASVEKKREIIKKVFENLAIQINDTHPAILVPETMRVLLDEFQLDWDEAWEIVHKTIAYTNHTVRPEALEMWEIDLFKKVLPRHYSIVERINTGFRKDIKSQFPGNDQLINRTEIIDRINRRVNMARLSIVGAHSVNGVARLHSDILKADLFKDFYQIYPEKFNNKTNGINHRRFLLKANPELAELLDRNIGGNWRADCNEFQKIHQMNLAENEVFVKTFQQIKQIKKRQLAEHIKTATGVEVDINSLFDSHVKRFHEYKRQLMQILHILVLIKEIADKPKKTFYPRTFIFAGKSPEDYYEAKLTIQCVKYAQDMAEKYAKDKIKVVFIPNYNVTWAEKIFTGSDLSEQIPKAGQEASGTGLFKALFNGALIIGTHDGANIEVAEAVGDQNIFLFGTKVEEINEPFDPKETIAAFPPLEEVLLELKHHPDYNFFYHQLVDQGDPWAILRDFMEFYNLQEDLVAPFYFKHPYEWSQKAIRALGSAGGFSSDRTIREYAKEIWGLL